MSLFALLSTAVAIPLCIASIMFFLFFLKAKSSERKKAQLEQRRQERQSKRESARASDSSFAPGMAFASVPASGDSVPEFRPLSFYIEKPRLDLHGGAHPISEIPGMDLHVQRALTELGYTSVEQVAQWGRADVRAVSALLGVDAGLIESKWIANARMLLSVA
ncbi:MAG: hypothetical protein R2834_01605 [Rhodothermales bacterium]